MPHTYRAQQRIALSRVLGIPFGEQQPACEGRTPRCLAMSPTCIPQNEKLASGLQL